MAIIRQDYGSIGGGIKSILADTTATALGSITSTSSSYTATEDCIMIGYLYGNGSNSAGVSVKDTSNTDLGRLVGSWANSASIGNENCAIGRSSDLGFIIPKGYTITSDGIGTYNLHFYPIK